MNTVEKVDRKFNRGVVWSVLEKFANQITVLVVTIVLARILTPEAFGLVAMVTTITGFASMFIDLGFGASIIQREKVSQQELSSIFWVLQLIGLLLTIVIYLAAGLIADFYGEPDLQPIGQAMSLTFLLTSAGSLQLSMLRRDLRFKEIFLANLFSTIISGGLAIILAYLSFGVWSIIVQRVLLALTLSIVAWRFSNWMPSFTFSSRTLVSHFKFGASLTGISIINYWSKNIDRLLVGKFIGIAPAGIYSKAYQFASIPQNITSSVQNVIFPAISRIKQDKAEVKRLIVNVTVKIILYLVPVLLFFFVFSEELVIFVLGPKWISAEEIFGILSLGNIGMLMSAAFGGIFLAYGRPELLFLVQGISKLGVIVMLIIGVQYGLIGVATTFSIGMTLSSAATIFIAGTLINLSGKSLVLGLKNVLILNLLFLGGLVIARNLLIAHELISNAVLLIAICGLLGGGYIIIGRFVLNIKQLDFIFDNLHLGFDKND